MMEKMSVTALAAMMGTFVENMPNNSQSRVPKAKSEYMGSDKPETSLVLIVLTAWGKNDMVVLAAAARPKMVMLFNLLRFLIRKK